MSSTFLTREAIAELTAVVDLRSPIARIFIGRLQ